MSELEIVSEGLQKIGSVMASLESGHALKFIKAVMDRRMDLSLEDVIFKSGQNYTVSRGGRDVYNILARDDGDFDFVKVDPRDAILKSLLASVSPILTQLEISHISGNCQNLIIVTTTAIYVNRGYVILYNYKLHNMTGKKDNIYFICNDKLKQGSFTLDSTKEKNEVLGDIDHQIKLLEIYQKTISIDAFELINPDNFQKLDEDELFQKQGDVLIDIDHQNKSLEIFQKTISVDELEKLNEDEQAKQEFKVFEIMYVDELRKMQLHNFGLVIHEKFQVAIEQCSDSILIENKYPKHCIDWLKKECADKGYSFKRFLHGHFIEF